MRKYILVIMVFLFTMSPVVANAAFDTSLKMGNKGKAVTELQEMLVKEGCLSASPNGYFGSATLRAVKCFQTKYKLPSSGFFRPMSRIKAKEVNTKSTSSVKENIAQTEKPNINQPVQQTPKTFTLPNGVVIDSLGNIISSPFTQQNQNVVPVDVCSNIEGVQTTVPGGMSAVGNVCTFPQVLPPQITDMCQNIAGVQSSVPNGMTLQGGSCINSSPTTSVLLPKKLSYTAQSLWPNDSTYGSVNDFCSNCVVLITAIPTKANIYLTEYVSLRGGPALDEYIEKNPQSVSIYADNNLSNTHVFLFSNLGIDQTKKYHFKVDAIDENGNKYIQEFTGVDSTNTSILGPFKWNENQIIKWSNEYDSKYMKSNYYVDVPLIKIQ